MPKDKGYENYLVEAKNEVMRAKMPYSEIEQKLVAMIISVINPTDSDFKEYSFDKSVLLNILNLGGKNHAYLYKVTEGLLSNPIEIRDKSKGDKPYQANIIADADYIKNPKKVIFTVAPKMKEYLLQLHKGEFTKFYLSNVMGLASKYSISMYRFLKSYEFQKIVTKPIEELRFCMGIESGYENFYMFKTRILDVAQIELEEKTDIRFNYTTETKRKKVVKITFTIESNEIGKIKILDTQISLYERAIQEKKERKDELSRSAEKAYPEERERVRKEIKESLEEAKRNRNKAEASLFINPDLQGNEADNRK
jgi:plasmid replication initiation protein